MFNRNAEFTIKIISGGIRSCKVRFPSDEEWLARARKMQVVEKDIGRGETAREIVGNVDADRELFEKIRLDGGTENFDEFEAQAFIGRLEQCRVVSSERNGAGFHISMDALKSFPVVHVLRIPTQKDLNDFRAARPRVRLGRGYEKLPFSLDPHVLLWSRVASSTEGYADESVPVIHKYEAVSELLARVGDLMDSDDPEV